MKLVLIYVVMVLVDAFYLGGATWLVVEKGWSGWTIVGAYFLCYITDPGNFIKALQKERS